MTTFLAFPDLHGHTRALKTIRHIIADVDAVLLPGDMTSGSAEQLQRVRQSIEVYNENILAVCGNMDTEAMNMQLAREGVSLHRRHQMLDGIAVLGVGGALPYLGQYVFSEEQFAQYLEDSLQGVPADAPKILLLHQPPYGTAVDRLEDGQHVGSKAVRAFIERVQPLVALSGHIHNAVGIDQLGATQLINSGPLAQTQQYVFLDIDDGVVKTLELRSVEGLGV